MAEPAFPPSGGTPWKESRMNFDADAFARLAHDLSEQPNLEKTLEKIVESAVAVLGCDYAGLLMTSKGHQLVAITATDPAARKADKLQIELQEGPGIAAVAEARTIVVHDTAADMRWPRWAAGMRDLHLGSVLAVQLGTSQSTLGALNLYAGTRRWFDTDALAAAGILGGHASIALSSARQEESLRQAIDARTLIGRAQGILMERFAIDDQAAFDVLRRHSQNTNTKLNEVARILISSRALPKY